MNLKVYCALVGAVGLAYGYQCYRKYINANNQLKDLTRKISQQLKHQMIIMCITFSKKDKGNQTCKHQSQFILLKNKLIQIYSTKSQLIIQKYTTTPQLYQLLCRQYLQRCQSDEKIKQNTQEIMEMMRRALNGQTPDFTINAEVYKAFVRQDLLSIYRQFLILVCKRITLKIHQKLHYEQMFNFRKFENCKQAMEDIFVDQLKTNLLKQNRFKQIWGQPNQVFYKYLESEKIKDNKYEKKIIKYQKSYLKIIEDLINDPKKMTLIKIDQIFQEAHDRLIIEENLAQSSIVQSNKIASSQQKKQKQMCIVCVQKQPNMKNTRCFHLAVCQKCSLQLKKQCPICRATGGIYKKIFKP